MSNTNTETAVNETSLIESYDAVSGDNAATERRAMRKSWNAAMVAAVTSGDVATAQIYVAADVAVSARRTTRAAVEIDYVGATAQRVADLRLAADMIESGTVRPFGSPDDDDWTDQLSASDVTPDDETARSLAQTRVAGQRDVSAQIASVVATGKKGDSFTAAAIRAGHPDSSSVGAIAQALDAVANGSREIDGVRVVTRDGKRVAVRS